jgi:hypothetical protein
MFVTSIGVSLIQNNVTEVQWLASLNRAAYLHRKHTKIFVAARLRR